VRFGLATQRLGERLDSEGAEPEPELPLLASGRVDRAAADALFAQRRSTVESAPDDWRGWYRLALAYDVAGDRGRARSAMRTAIDRAEP
jgi:cytochrome c-type biogenesis protein CcmH/NrfG